VWRRICLFAAHDVDELEGLLAAMPSLTIQRLAGAISNRSRRAKSLIAMTITTAAGAPQRVVGDAWMRQARRADQLGEEGHLMRLWTGPGQPVNHALDPTTS